MKVNVIMGYKVVQTDDVVGEPAIVTRFKWRAFKRCDKMNAMLLNLGLPPTFRWEVERREDGKWTVVAMQNVLALND